MNIAIVDDEQIELALAEIYIKIYPPKLDIEKWSVVA